MSLFSFMTDDDAAERIQQRMSDGGSTVYVILIASLLIVTGSAVVVWPIDTFSTAIWYDEVGVRLIYSAPFGLAERLFGQWSSDPLNMSIEGFSIATLVQLATIIIGMRVKSLGPWAYGENELHSFWSFVWNVVRRKIKAKDVNANKVNFWLTWTVLVVADTWTGAEFLSSTGFHYFMSWVFSLVVYNFGSEYCLIEGSRLMIACMSLIFDGGEGDLEDYVNRDNPANPVPGGQGGA